MGTLEGRVAIVTGAAGGMAGGIAGCRAAGRVMRAQRSAREAIGLARMGSPHEMGALCAFLAGDDASLITGAAITLTGGEQWFF